MSHWRTSRAISGGNQQSPGSHMREAILPRNSNSIRLDEIFGHSHLPDLRGGETVSSFLKTDDRELAAKCFVAGIVTVVGLFLFASWFVISQFIA